MFFDKQKITFVILSIENPKTNPQFYIQKYDKVTDHNGRYYYVHGLDEYIDKDDINKPMQNSLQKDVFFVYLINPTQDVIKDYKSILKHDLLYKLKYQKDDLIRRIEKVQKLEGV